MFLKISNSCANYGLDPAYHYTLSNFTWDAMLKHTHVKFEFLTDIDMVFIEYDIHRGLSQCSNRYAQTNNKYMPYESSKPSIYLMYFDINNCMIGQCVNYYYTLDTIDRNFDVTIIRFTDGLRS